jgi:hypothetical protein
LGSESTRRKKSPFALGPFGDGRGTARPRHFEELTDAEIAEKLALTEHQVRDRDYQARKKLKRRLEQLYGPGAERL